MVMPYRVRMRRKRRLTSILRRVIILWAGAGRVTGVLKMRELRKPWGPRSSAGLNRWFRA